MTPPTENTPVDRQARRAQMLAELAELTFSAARHAHDKLLAAETSAEVAETSLAFHRVARALRQTLLLETKFEADVAAKARDAARDSETLAEAAQARAAADAERLREARTAKVNHEMVRAVMEHAESAEQGETLLTEMRFCLNAYVHGHDWDRRSLEDLIADFCQDLGIAPSWEAAVREDEASEPDEPADNAAQDAADERTEAEAMAEAAPPEPPPEPPPAPPPPPQPPPKPHPFDGWVRGPHGGWEPPPNSS